jgi:hypothetical protein
VLVLPPVALAQAVAANATRRVVREWRIGGRSGTTYIIAKCAQRWHGAGGLNRGPKINCISTEALGPTASMIAD